MSALLAALVSYLIGSVSFAVVVSKVMGLADPHTYGSGNPGATNVLRTGNKLAALLTLLGDAAKGWVAVMLARMFAPPGEDVSLLVALSAVAVFLGHLFPVFHRFAGGKGVATALGILLAIAPVLGLATLGTWLIVAVFFRYSSLAALISAVFAPFYDALLFGWEPGNRSVVLVIAAMSLLLIWRHRANLRKLAAGQESKIGQKSKPAEPDA
ncbi:MAG: glycerol-3-phosphate 1-O-acyltransferase PlsY [Candidatus Protistobacter heckmanni]|nr:glycerol-3-phosphate 1-O-acyltransferase PlsY [Candidatus Protistobacter heckmanni]